MAQRYGGEPENAVKFKFDGGELNFFQRMMVKFFTPRVFAHVDVLCVRFFGGSVMTRLTSLARGIAYQRTLVLKTIGSKTGQIRTCGPPYGLRNRRRRAWKNQGSNCLMERRGAELRLRQPVPPFCDRSVRRATRMATH